MKLIVACTPEGGIGFENSLPWKKLEGDLPRFKRLTDNKTVVMGRNTWESLPFKPLKFRQNIVITSTPLNFQHDLVSVYSNLNSIPKDSWLIGGAKLIESNWDLIDEVHLSRTFALFKCDVFINMLYLESNFVKTYSESFKDHDYQIWKRRS